KYDSNEDVFNQLYTWSYLDLIGSSINTDECKRYFIQGQPVLQSMGRQLKETCVLVDDKSQYKSDGLMKLFNLKDLELLLLETSGHFKNSDKYIADEYSFASVAKFSQCLLEQAVKNITDVENEHQKNSSKFRHNPEDYTQLSSIVSPVIIKLTKDSAGMGNLGPMYSPPHH
ncbi:hypothetical protein CU098_006160, partial [Rhizopus stolonifer]